MTSDSREATSLEEARKCRRQRVENGLDPEHEALLEWSAQQDEMNEALRDDDEDGYDR